MSSFKVRVLDLNLVDASDEQTDIDVHIENIYYSFV